MAYWVFPQPSAPAVEVVDSIVADPRYSSFSLEEIRLQDYRCISNYCPEFYCHWFLSEAAEIAATITPITGTANYRVRQ